MVAMRPMIGTATFGVVQQQLEQRAIPPPPPPPALLQSFDVMGARLMYPTVPPPPPPPTMNPIMVPASVSTAYIVCSLSFVAQPVAASIFKAHLYSNNADCPLVLVTKHSKGMAYSLLDACTSQVTCRNVSYQKCHL